MDDAMIAEHLENLDRQLARVQQILPTLATTEELRSLDRLARMERTLPALTTREELQATEGRPHLAIADAIADAVAPLATKDEIRELRRHMDVLSESQRGDIQLLVEHLADVMSKLTDR